MPKALAVWRDGRTRLVMVGEDVPLSITVLERPEHTEGVVVAAARPRTFSRAPTHRRAVIYEEPIEE